MEVVSKPKILYNEAFHKTPPFLFTYLSQSKNYYKIQEAKSYLCLYCKEKIEFFKPEVCHAFEM